MIEMDSMAGRRDIWWGVHARMGAMGGAAWPRFLEVSMNLPAPVLPGWHRLGYCEHVGGGHNVWVATGTDGYSGKS